MFFQGIAWDKNHRPGSSIQDIVRFCESSCCYMASRALPRLVGEVGLGRGLQPCWAWQRGLPPEGASDVTCTAPISGETS